MDSPDKFCKPSFRCREKPLSRAASALVEQLQEDRFIKTKVFHFSPPPGYKWTDVIRHEARLMSVIAEYEQVTGKPLRCRGFITRGPYGAEARVVFQKAPDMVLLKRLGRKYGNVKVTGDYDPGEDWRSLSQERRNCPPHSGCLRYVASHVDRDDALWVENAVAPKGRVGCDASADAIKRPERKRRRRRRKARKLRRGQNRRREEDVGLSAERPPSGHLD